MRTNAIDFMLKLNSNNEFSLDERNIGNNL